MRRIYGVIFLTLLLGLSGCSSMVKDGAMIRASNNYSDGDYEDTIEIVERSMHMYDYNDEEKSQLLFLKALSFQKLGDVQTAYSVLKYITYKFPETEYGFRAATILESVSQSADSSI
ncbi:hypothetical protein BTA51_24200 [Hahella sp. CCB-MM4]|uniref:tetratricopeptide repeat protein n=1 Tax=Hahella sp. (strain CCB-MM4) TaxID=1926491 RepID=UPI000BC46177|nr:hypothetical protein [Hahella sp. CCB-MM4]OZG70699.1 hypothetical protein BTA51_24200 [Hahella sp. CCB-MM4]